MSASRISIPFISVFMAIAMLAAARLKIRMITDYLSHHIITTGTTPLSIFLLFREVWYTFSIRMGWVLCRFRLVMSHVNFLKVQEILIMELTTMVTA